MTRKKRDRDVKELYDLTHKLSEPEITPVLKGSCRIQGPMEDTEYGSQTSSIAYLSEKRSAKHPHRNFHSRAVSGTCNMCAAPCSSCMHYNQTASAMESGGCTEEASFTNAGVSPVCKSLCDDQQHTASEASNLVSSCSSHDSFSENADSKETSRMPDGHSKDVEMLLNLSSGEAARGAEVLAEVARQHNDNSKTSSDRHIEDVVLHKPPTRDEELHGAERHWDYTPCVSGVVDESMSHSDLNRNLDKETISFSLASASGPPNRDSKKVLKSQFIHGKIEENEVMLSGTDICNKDSSQINYSTSFCKTGSDNPDPSDCQPLNGSSQANSSLPCSQIKISSHQDIELKDIEESSSCHSKGVTTEILVEQKDGDISISLSVETVVQNKEATVDCVSAYTGNRDTGHPSDELVMCNISQGQTIRNPSTLNLQPQENIVCENNELDLEDDVKVCDICGDAGIEEMLAICSRCSDGAEHTYCMRKMLDKVPDGDWLCEGCKFKEDAETKKVDKSETSGIRKAVKGLQGSHGSSNGLLEGVEVNSVLNRKAPEATDPNGTLSETANSSLRPSLNRDNSSKSLDTTKMKLGDLVSGNHSASIHSLSKTQAQHQSPRGTLKLSFDNLKPKVKQVQNVPPKTRLIIESTADGVKKERVPTIGKSVSFKSTNTIRSNKDAASKTHSTNRMEDMRSIIPGKQRNTIEKKNSFNLDRSRTSSSTVAAASIPLSKSDSKIIRTDGKVDSSLTVSKVSEDTRGLVGLAQVKKQLPYASKSSGIVSGKSSSVDQNSGQYTDEAFSGSNIGGRNSDADVQHGFSHSGKFATHDEKKDIGCSRHQLLTGGRILCCQRCHETGHATQFCSVDKLRLSALKPSNERISKDAVSKSNKWKDAVEAAVSKTRMYKHNKLSDQLNEVPASSNDINREISPNDQVSKPSAQDRNSATAERTVDMLDTSRPACSSSRTADLKDAKQNIFPPGETTHVSNDGDSAITAGKAKVKPVMQMLPEQAYLRTNSLRISAIPEFDYIWQGSFEVQRTGRVSEICDSIQAHLSTCASPKAIDVVTKFPRKIQLEEVPCMSSWPSQFQIRNPTEENIALFFFATDFESHEKYYKKLLENMLKNDMVLQGKLDGVELLIFPSNKLPERAQRWNRLFFLWGVFRANKSNCLVPLSGVQQLSGNHLNAENLAQDFSLPLPVEAKLKRVKASEMVDEESPISDKIKGENNQYKIDMNSSDFKSLDQVKMSKDQQSINSFSEKMLSTILEHNNISDNCHEEITEENTNQLCREVKEEAACLGDNASNLKTLKGDENASFPTSGREIVSNKDKVIPSYFILPNGPEKLPDPTELPVSAEGTITGSSKSGGELNTCKRFVKAITVPSSCTENIVDKEKITSKEPSVWYLRPSRKHSRSNSPEPFSQTSNGKTVPWKEQEHFIHDQQRESKKTKLCGKEHSAMKRKEAGSHIFSSKVHPVLEALENEASQRDSTIDIDLASSTLCSERLFLSGNSSLSELQPVNFFSLPVVSPVEEDALHPDTPSLELALGAEKKSSKQGLLPLFFPLGGNEIDEVKPPDPSVDDGDDVLASLSLSLAFPLPEKKQAAPKRTEQLLPERPHSNSSLLLFGSRFTDS